MTKPPAEMDRYANRRNRRIKQRKEKIESEMGIVVALGFEERFKYPLTAVTNMLHNSVYVIYSLFTFYNL
jgi:hypothetical protein